MRALWSLLAFAVFASYFGCADPVAVSSTFNQVGGGGGSSASASSGEKGASSASGAGASSVTSSGAVSSTSSSVASSSSSGGASSSSSSTGSGSTCDFTAPEDCESAELLMQIDGDQNMDTRIEKGTTSRWFKILVHEGVSSVISYPSLSYTATLENAPGMQFDLYAYPGDINEPDCTANPLAGVGDPETISEDWPDSVGSDDSRWYIFEVRYVSGASCDVESQWTLTIEGNTSMGN